MRCNSTSIRSYGVALALLGTAASLPAELEWRQQTLRLNPPAGADEVAGTFEFVNRGTMPVHVTDVESDCGCTVMAAERDPIPPGGKGSIRAVFHVGSRKGRQSVAVAVRTREPEPKTYALKLEVAIKEFATVTPGLLYWKLGDDPAPKVLRVTLAPGFHFVAAESANGEFGLEMAGTGRDAVDLKVQPRDTWAKRSGLIRIRVAQQDQPPVEVTAQVKVL